MADDFYATLARVDEFNALADPASYHPLPAGWSLAVADVAGSTRAIAAGEYKAVNTAGVSVIAAVTNALKPLDLPFVFGGDGALVAVPPVGADAARRALAATAAMAHAVFGLELRTAVVPVDWLRSQGRDVRVARHRVSEHFDQCALDGGGAAFAEARLKDGTLPAEFRVAPDASIEGDYSGLECRWSEIPSPDEETVAVIVSAKAADGGLPLYRRVMDKIAEIYGGEDACHPVSAKRMRLSLASRVLKHESLPRTFGQSLAARWRYALIQRVQVIIGWWFFRTGATTGDTDWGRYKQDAAANSDFRKFDGCLRLVLAGDLEKRRALHRYLEGLRDAGAIDFGIHAATSAIMTCLVRQRQFEHAHFIDAAGGGYAVAAQQMKAR